MARQRGVEPLRRNMALVGDRWALLIVQSVFLHVRRYDELRTRLGISPTTLSDRLRSLVQAEVLEQVPYRAANRTHHEYRLTEHGLPLWQLLVALWSWEADWVPGRVDELPLLAHTECGSATTPLLCCQRCGDHVGVRDVTATRQDNAPVAAYIGKQWGNKRFSRKHITADDPILFFPTTMELLGDPWSTGILVCAFLGLHHFNEFQLELGIGPTVLSARLRRLVTLDVLHTTSAHTRTDARAYRLTNKGKAFFPAVATIIEWTRTQYQDDSRQPITLHHVSCEHQLGPMLRCSICHEALHRTTIRIKPH